MFDLTGKIALVTGAGQGIGAAIAHFLAAQGASVAVNDLRQDRAEAVAAQLRTRGFIAKASAFDVTDYAAVTAAIEEIGRIDILVNNAGNGGEEALRPQRFRDSEPVDWQAAIDVNLHGVMHCSRAVINGMHERSYGRIITIASDAARIGVTLGVCAYAAGKGGAIAFMRHLAIENARAGVTANTIALGLMDSVDTDRNAAAIAAIPVGRLGTGLDVGPLVVYFASDESAWMTGQLISINGGQSTF